MANASPWIITVSFSARDQMDVAMENGLASDRALVDAYVKPRDIAI